MKKIATTLIVAGLATLGFGMNAGAVTQTAPTVSPSSGAPGFEFTVTVADCPEGDTVVFDFPTDPPAQSVTCPTETTTTTTSPSTTVQPTTTTTVRPTTTTTTTTTTTSTTSTTTTTTEVQPTTTEPECPPEECIRPQFAPVGVATQQATPEPTPVSATFTAPDAPGVYQGTVQSGLGTQPFSITVVAGTLPASGNLPVTGNGAEPVMLAIGAAFLAAGFGLLTAARRSTAID